MPLIRYRNGDIGKISANPCPCGRNNKTIQIFGRSNCILELDGTRYTENDISEMMDIGGILLYQVRKGNDLIDIDIIISDDGKEDMIERAVKNRFKKITDLKITVNFVNTIKVEKLGKMRNIKILDNKKWAKK